MDFQHGTQVATNPSAGIQEATAHADFAIRNQFTNEEIFQRSSQNDERVNHEQYWRRETATTSQGSGLVDPITTLVEEGDSVVRGLS